MATVHGELVVVVDGEEEEGSKNPKHIYKKKLHLPCAFLLYLVL